MRLFDAFASNVIGQVVAIGIALAMVPLFTTYFGAERYGCYLLLLAFQPYFGIHQLAAARLVTVASARSDLGDRGAPLMLRSMLLTGTVFSTIFTLAFLALYPVISKGFSSNPLVAGEVTAAALPAGALILLTTVTLLHTHRLDGQRRFTASNLVSNSGNLLALLLPLLPGLYDGSFDRLVWAVALARMTQVGLGWWLLPQTAWWQDLAHLAREALQHAREFGWLTLSSLGSATIATGDRIILGITTSATALYFYAVPLGIAGRLVVLAAALGRAMSPQFSTASADRSRMLVREASNAILALMLALTIPLSIIAFDLMQLWVGREFAREAAPVFRLALVGLVGMSLSQAPAILLHSTGRARQQVWLQAAEVVPFVAAVWIASGDGLVAVASVVVVRNCLDGLAHMWLVGLGWRSTLRAILVIALVLGVALSGPWFDTLPAFTRLGSAAGLTLVGAALGAIMFPATVKLARDQLRRYARSKGEGVETS